MSTDPQSLPSQTRSLRTDLATVERVLPTSDCGTLLSEVWAATREDLGGSAYFESIDGETEKLCRVEKFTEVFPTAHRLLRIANDIACDSFGGDVVLMKDKLNIKWPGGGGYRCHQDSRAYPPHLAPVLSVGIALTPCDDERGGLYLAGGVRDLLPADQRGCVSESERASLDFACPTLRPGDALLFSGYVPHYSGANTSNEPRVIALLTYVARGDDSRSDGDVRNEYYSWREEEIRKSGGTRLSTIDDFSGVLLDH